VQEARSRARYHIPTVNAVIRHHIPVKKHAPRTSSYTTALRRRPCKSTHKYGTTWDDPSDFSRPATVQRRYAKAATVQFITGGIRFCLDLYSLPGLCYESQIKASYPKPDLPASPSSRTIQTEERNVSDIQFRGWQENGRGFVAISEARMRVAIGGQKDTVELRLADSYWTTETGERVELDSLVTKNSQGYLKS
jgi:hypothetical protein